MKKAKWLAPALWLAALLAVTGALLAANRHFRVPTGIPGDKVTFGMNAEEVLEAAGVPDDTSEENGLRTGFFRFHYRREVLGRPATVSYTFNGRREDKNARVTEAAVSMEFETQAECDGALEALCAHFRELMRDEPRFDEYTRQGPVRAWDPPELLQTCTITSVRRGVTLTQLPGRITVIVRN